MGTFRTVTAPFYPLSNLKLGLQHVIRITAIQWLQSSITRLLASPSIRSVMFVLPRNTNLMA
jgi:hypothetical protein